jgi:hypothetical protein
MTRRRVLGSSTTSRYGHGESRGLRRDRLRSWRRFHRCIPERFERRADGTHPLRDRTTSAWTQYALHCSPAQPGRLPVPDVGRVSLGVTHLYASSIRCASIHTDEWPVPISGYEPMPHQQSPVFNRPIRYESCWTRAACFIWSRSSQRHEASSRVMRPSSTADACAHIPCSVAGDTRHKIAQ